jgi:hypothetical protein
MRVHRLLVCVALAFLFITPNLTFASQASANRQAPGQAVRIGEINVGRLPPIQASLSGSGKIIPNFVSSVQASTESVVSASSTTAPSSGVSVTSNLDGVFGGAPNQCGCTPPDTNLGVGTRHVFEVVNIAGIIYLKNGALARSTFSLADFFKVSASSLIGDPEVMFDSGSGRWFVSSIVAPNNIEFAVSTSDDATGGYVLYTVLGGSSFPDQPFIGTNDDKFVISVNAFTTKFLGAEFWVLNKAELVNGATSVDFVTFGPDPTLFSAHPARHLTSSTNFYLVSVAFGSATAATLLTVTGAPPGPVSVFSNSFAVNPISNPPRATQPTTGTKLVTNDDRVLSATWESNVLWFSLTDSCVPNGDAKIRSCARLIEITTNGTGSPTKVQDFDYAVANTYLFYPAVSLSHGKLVLVFGETSSTIFPSLSVTGRNPTDPANSLQNVVTIRSGTANDESTRYGDYFGAATDPTGTSTFWVAGEYRVDEIFQNWSTAIAQVQIA